MLEIFRNLLSKSLILGVKLGGMLMPTLLTDQQGRHRNRGALVINFCCPDTVPQIHQSVCVYIAVFDFSPVLQDCPCARDQTPKPCALNPKPQNPRSPIDSKPHFSLSRNRATGVKGLGWQGVGILPIGL